MIDLVGDRGVVLPEGVVGQLRQVNYGFTTFHVLGGQVAQVLVDGPRTQAHRAVLAVEPAVAVITGVETGHLMTPGQQQRHQASADVTLTAGNENSHF